MHIELNFKSGKPAYLQIVEQVKYGAASGALRAGDQLPSIREMAERLRVNRNTVAKAYSELEHEGVVELQQGKGVFLTDGGSPLNQKTRNAILAEAIDGAVVQAHQFKIGRQELVELLRQRLDAFERRREEKS